MQYTNALIRLPQLYKSAVPLLLYSNSIYGATGSAEDKSYDMAHTGVHCSAPGTEEDHRG
jgi:hypothetical protein